MRTVAKAIPASNAPIKKPATTGFEYGHQPQLKLHLMTYRVDKKKK